MHVPHKHLYLSNIFYVRYSQLKYMSFNTGPWEQALALYRLKDDLPPTGRCSPRGPAYTSTVQPTKVTLQGHNPPNRPCCRYSEADQTLTVPLRAHRTIPFVALILSRGPTLLPKLVVTMSTRDTDPHTSGYIATSQPSLLHRRLLEQAVRVLNSFIARLAWLLATHASTASYSIAVCSLTSLSHSNTSRNPKAIALVATPTVVDPASKGTLQDHIEPRHQF